MRDKTVHRTVESFCALGAVCSIGASVFAEKRKHKATAVLSAIGGVVFSAFALYNRDQEKLDKELLEVVKGIKEVKIIHQVRPFSPQRT